MQQYETELKGKIFWLHLEEGRTLNSLSNEYGVSKASISIWVKSYREGCPINQETKEDYNYMLENCRLRK